MKIFLRVLCVLLAVLSAAGLFAASLVSAVLYSVRDSLSPAFVKETAENLDFASIRFPDGFGGFTTIPEQLNESFAPHGFSVTGEQFNGLCRELGFDAILGDWFLEFRGWLLDDGPVPQIDLRSAAEAAVSGAEEGSLVFVSDPVAFTMAVLASYVNERALTSRLEALKPARELLSAGTLILALSFVLAFATLLLVGCRMKLFPALTVSGAVWALTGLALYFSPALAAPYKASLLGAAGVALESTFDIVYLPVMAHLSRTGLILLIGGAALFVLAAVLWIVTAAVGRHRRAVTAVPRGGEAVLPSSGEVL